MRKLIAVVLASSTFGGAVGALATAASQSAASPSAIAAAAVRVQDQKAENALAGINRRLGQVASSENAASSDLNAMRTDLGGTPNSALEFLTSQLQVVCEDLGYANRVAGAPVALCPLRPLPSFARR